MKKITKYLVIITNIFILYYLLIANNWLVYNMTYTKTLLFVFSICIFIYINGIVVNDGREYKRNILCYILFFYILLFAFTFIIGRPMFYFSKKYHLFMQLKPFYTITEQLKYGSTISILKNIIGNIIALIPSSFLLMLYNKKNENIFRQSLIIIPTILFIELFQDYSHTGAFDIDDIILNYFGVLIFTFLITRFHIIDKIRHLFNTDYNIKTKIKNILFYISLVVLIIIDVFVIMK